MQVANSYTGLTSITAGVLAYGINNAIPAANLVTINGATAALALGTFAGTLGLTTLQGGGSITGTTGVAGQGTLTVNTANTFELQSGTVTAILAGTGAMNKTTTGTVFLGAANTYTGATNIQAGTLVSGLISGTGVNNAITTTSAVTLGTATTLGVFDLNNANQTFASVTTAATTGLTSQIINSFASTTLPTLTINDTAADTYAGFLGTGTIGSVVGNAFNIVKIGAGTLQLGGANTFTGTATVQVGILQTGNAKALGSVPQTGSTTPTTIVLTGAELDLNAQNIDPNEIISIAGTGVASAGALINSNATAATLSQLIYDITNGIASTSVGPAAVTSTIVVASGATNPGYILSSAPSTGGGNTGNFTLTKVGQGNFVINIANDPDLNNININAGVVTIANAAGAGIGTATATVQANATLSLSTTSTINGVKNVVLNGGALAPPTAPASSRSATALRPTPS